ncbi:MAG: YceD family protein [Steroidobacteraceae bacterium]
MPRPGPHRADLVDAIASAAVGTAWQRHFNLDELTRIREAGALTGTELDLSLHSVQRDGHVELEGELGGQLVLTCQRCLQPAVFALNEPIALRVIRDEELAPAEGEHEYVVADPTRLDLRWLSEEQALLATPLVPMHEPDRCPQGDLLAAEETEAEPSVAQSPFANLRDMLKKS